MLKTQIPQLCSHPAELSVNEAARYADLNVDRYPILGHVTAMGSISILIGVSRGGFTASCQKMLACCPLFWVEAAGVTPALPYRAT